MAAKQASVNVISNQQHIIMAYHGAIETSAKQRKSKHIKRHSSKNMAAYQHISSININGNKRK